MFKFVYQSSIYFYQFEKWLYAFIVMNKDLLMLCITYYSRLKILRIQSDSVKFVCLLIPDSNIKEYKVLEALF